MIAFCDQKGCDYKATHAKLNYARAMVGRHKNYVHGIKGKHYIPKAQRVVGNSPPEPKAATVVPNYCPCCGTSLRAIMVAMNLGRKS